MKPKKKEMSKGTFFAIMAGLGIGFWLLRILFAILVGIIAFYIFRVDSDTAFFAGIMGYLLPRFVLGILELIPYKSKR